MTGPDILKLILAYGDARFDVGGSGDDPMHAEREREAVELAAGLYRDIKTAIAELERAAMKAPA